MASVPVEMRNIMRPAVAEMERMFTTERPVTVYHPETGIPSTPLRWKMHNTAQKLHDALWEYVQRKQPYQFGNLERRGTPEGDAFSAIAPLLEDIKRDSLLGGGGQWDLIGLELVPLKRLSAKAPEQVNFETLGVMEGVSKKGFLNELPIASAAGDLQRKVKSYLEPKKGGRRKTRKGKGKSRKTLRRRR